MIAYVKYFSVFLSCRSRVEVLVCSLMKLILARFPQQKHILMTGYVAIKDKNLDIDDLTSVLLKPFSIYELSARLNQVLNGEEERGSEEEVVTDGKVIV